MWVPIINLWLKKLPLELLVLLVEFWAANLFVPKPDERWLELQYNNMNINQTKKKRLKYIQLELERNVIALRTFRIQPSD